MLEKTPVRQWVLAAAGLAMIGGAGWLVFRERAPVPTEERAPSGRTAIYVEREGAAMRLHWNPESPDVRAAERGAILISDGKRESRLELTPRDLRAGVASYWPESKDVSFHLELDGGEAGYVRAAAPLQDRPSPFEVAKEPARRKAHAVKRVQPAVEEAKVEKRESGFSRAVGKIPLLRRLRGRDKRQD
jgi:hypothetical protein